MKKLLSFFTAIFAVIFSTAQLVDSCAYTIEMHDSWGDGWNGSELQVSVNGNSSAIGLDDGSDSTATVEVMTGDIIDLGWLGGGLWDAEISFELLNSTGDTIFAQGLDPVVGGLSSDTAACPSTAGLIEVKINTLSVYPNPNNGKFFIANNGDANNIEMHIFNIQSKEVYNSVFNLSAGGTEMISLKDLNAGMYLVLLNTEKGRSMHNIVIE